ncbi:MAG: hypothetical protein HY049_06380 [Acidobacteria bacterium]|nr:hypothetical protein [Acidobacteriota bacterium]
MSSSRAEALALASVLAVSILSAAPAYPGFRVNVAYVDPNGSSVSAAGTDAQFVFHRRTLYRTPRGPEGERFHDEEIRLDSFSFQGHRISFQKLREVRFERRARGDHDELIITVEMVSGERIERKGSELDGADHPTSPSLEFRTAGGPIALPLDPLLGAAARAGRPSLTRVSFPDNPDRRPVRRR